MIRINEIVDKMLKEHKEGNKFFDNLDEAIRTDRNILSAFLDRVEDMLDSWSKEVNHIIVSGNFGRALHNFGISEHFWIAYDIGVVVVNGSLRKDEPIDNFGEFMNSSDGNYVFLDDSFYSGKTRDVIKDKIESYGGQLVHTYVLYDGSKDEDESVSSMYRYYDNH